MDNRANKGETENAFGFCTRALFLFLVVLFAFSAQNYSQNQIQYLPSYSTTQIHSSPNIKVFSVCEQQLIKIKVFESDGKPISEAKVELFSRGGGRRWLEETTTDSEGIAYFMPKAKGEYDIVAYPKNQLKESLKYRIVDEYYQKEIYKGTKETYFKSKKIYETKEDFIADKNKMDLYGQIVFSLPYCQNHIERTRYEKDEKNRQIKQNDEHQIGEWFEGNTKKQVKNIYLKNGMRAKKTTLTQYWNGEGEFSYIIEKLPQDVKYKNQIEFDSTYADFINIDSGELAWKVEEWERKRGYAQRSYLILG